jgi:hypothetical protein
MRLIKTLMEDLINRFLSAISFVIFDNEFVCDLLQSAKTDDSKIKLYQKKDMPKKYK